MYITRQGSVSTSGTKLYEAKKIPVIITRLMFSNTSGVAYTITLKKHSVSSGASTVQVYTFDCPAGCIFEDTGPYTLDVSEYFLVTSSVSDTVFILEGNDQNIR